MKQKHRVLKRCLLIISIFLLTIFLSLSISLIILYNKYKLDVQALTSVNNGIKVYSAFGTDNTLYNTNRSIIEIETVPEYVKNAFIDIEDKHFYKHNGYDLKRIIKAGVVNLTTKSKSQGASTISQQLIKNALLTNEKTYSRKIQEIILSIKMEKQFSKDEILEMYLNTIYFGSNAYGIENASKVYFNKSAKDLTLSEACCLAGIIKSPNYFSPKKNYDNAIKRRNIVAKAVFKANHITEQEYNQIINSKLEINNSTLIDHSYEEEAILEACNLLNISERELINKKYQIITFKDDKLQNILTKTTSSIVENNLDCLNIVLDSNGNVLAYNVKSAYNLHNLKRQPASLFKPLAVYMPCITHNMLSPASEVLDEEINYNGYSPKNADNSYHGYVSIKQALANSLNVPAVKCLDIAGLKNAKECLSKFDINIESSDMNLSLALGCTQNGVKILDLASAYSILANNGEKKGVSFVNKILTEDNTIIYEKEDYSETKFDKDDCFLITDMLKESVKNGTCKRLASLNIPLASKTGTACENNKNTDIYNVAYTSQHTVLSWIGNISNQYLPTNYHSSFQPTEINKQILAELYKDNPPEDFSIPNNVCSAPYDLVELNTNHILVAPKTNLDRYTAYSYFKTDNLPLIVETNSNINLDVYLNNLGANISFETRKNLTYNLYKKINDNKTLLATICENNGKYSYIDSNIYKFDKVEYFVEIDGVVKSNIATIMPKDYIVNKLNNEIISQKRKWYV